MSPCLIDHLAIAAPCLESGAELVRQVLGVSPQPGGEHPRMGTHNLLLRLGDGLFLEVIAANPHAPPPGRPRWFGLDGLAADAPPALAAWVARSEDIRAAAAAASEPLGAVEPMSRGALDWLITIPADGSRPLGGAGPALIQWCTGGHPADRLEDRGLALAGLELLHPEPQRLARLLASLAVEGPVAVRRAAAPGLVAHIDTPAGRRRLASSPSGS